MSDWKNGKVKRGSTVHKSKKDKLNTNRSDVLMTFDWKLNVTVQISGQCYDSEVDRIEASPIPSTVGLRA